MTEEQSRTEEEQPGSEVVDELHSLGAQLVTAFKGLWDSEESQKLRKEIGDGFIELGHQVDEAVRTAQESEAAKEFKVQVQESLDKARESELTTKLQENLVSGLRQLNAELGKVVSSMETHGGTGEKRAPEPEGDPQDSSGE